MRELGYGQAAIDKFLAQHQATGEALFAVHPDNVLAVRLVQAMGTQWDTTSLSTWNSARIIRTGLKYEGLERTARLEGLGEISADDFRRVRIFEAEALAAWAEAAR